MNAALARLAAATVALLCTAPIGAAPALGQAPEHGPEPSPDIVRAVEQASLVRVRTRQFSARLERPRLEPGGFHFEDAEIEIGDVPAPDIPRPIPFRDVVQVDVFRPHTLLAAGVGFAVGYLVAAAAIRSQERECLDPLSLEPCSPPLSPSTKMYLAVGTGAVFVPIAIYADRARFAWRTVYRSGAF